MTQARAPDDRDLECSLRRLDSRVSRLEHTQVTSRELNESFGRVYEEIHDFKAEINQQFDRLEAANDQRFDAIDSKFDIIIRRSSKLRGILTKL